MDFPLLGEPLAVDLVNTRVHGPDGPADLIADVPGLVAWLGHQRGRLATPPGGIGKAELSAVLRMREHVATALDHVRRDVRPPARNLREFVDAQRAAPLIRELAWEGSAPVATAWRDGTPAQVLAAELAEAAVDLLANPAVAKVRECEGHGCVLLFLPAHPRRRWCSAATCGNRARVARYYQRHRGA